MLTITDDPNLIKAVNFQYNGLISGEPINNVDLELDLASGLMVTIFSDDNAKCTQVNKIRFPINFEKEGEKILVSPRKDGAWKGVIALQFNKPVFGAGARIGVAGLGTPRHFRAMFRAYDTEGKEYKEKYICTSTNKSDNSAKFLGVISTGIASITRIEFDAEPIIGGGNPFAKFAISTLFYKHS